MKKTLILNGMKNQRPWWKIFVKIEKYKEALVSK